MSEAIRREAFSFPSCAPSHTTIHGTIWHPSDAAQPRGIVILVHGMAEYIGRYDSFACFLAEHGFIVAGHDHLGHGASVEDSSQWGCLPAHGGADVLIEDTHHVHELVAERYPELPVFLFGHSMGSFIVRAYLPRYGNKLAGAIICGTGHVPLATSRFGNLAARFFAGIRGENTKVKFLDSVGSGAYIKQIDNPRTEADWLSYNEDNVDRYCADKACGFMFSAGGYVTLTDLTGRIATSGWAEDVPKALPLLLTSGSDDPVGGCGAGVRAVAALLEDAGVVDVTLTLYEGMRHEILNENDHQRVYADILDWIEAHLS